MRFSDWFKSKATKEDIEKLEKINKISFKKAKKDINELKKQVETDSKEIKIIKKRILTLEEILQPTKEKRPSRPKERPIPTKADQKLDQRQLDFDRFSEQERNILNVFLEHKDMRLSYIDIGKSLNKSPITIKNQLNKIRKEHDIFEEIKEKGRNRLKLVRGLEAKKILQ